MYEKKHSRSLVYYARGVSSSMIDTSRARESNEEAKVRRKRERERERSRE